MKRKLALFILTLILPLVPFICFAQPRATRGEVLFTIDEPKAAQVCLAGKFNGWASTANPVTKVKGGVWSLVLKLSAGSYQYKFVIDGNICKEDPHNPMKMDDNYGGFNSLITVTKEDEVLLGGYLSEELESEEEYPQTEETIYLNIIWHQHLPLYFDALKDQLQGPCVRCHSTKVYYDMASVIREYSDIHVTINLTSSLCPW